VNAVVLKMRQTVLRRKVLMPVGGLLIMVLAGTMLHIENPPLVGRTLWETFFLTIHGFGSMPLLEPLKGLWGLAVSE
jgi:hypothetical protein